MKAIGIILAAGNNKMMKELSNKRAIAAMPIAGKYRSIDFVLSNMSNSHINKVAVITQYNTKSLNEHLNSSKWWDFGRKQGGLYLFTPTITYENSNWYRGTADSMYQNMDFLKKSHEPYVVIASGDGIYKMDYNKVLEYHIEKQADITMVVTDIKDKEEAKRFGVLTLDNDNRVTNIEEKPIEPESTIVSTGIYIIRRRLLIELIEKSVSEERYDFVKDILARYRQVKKIYAYKYEEYWRNISTAESYYKTNMDFLNREIRDAFFKEYPNIHTKVQDLPPVKYNSDAYVKNSLVANGTIVNGTIENSVVFKKAYIGNNCVIKNSIILNDVYIGDNSYIENCIVEARGTIKANSTFVGNDGKIRIVVEKDEIKDYE